MTDTADSTGPPERSVDLLRAGAVRVALFGALFTPTCGLGLPFLALAWGCWQRRALVR